MVRGYHVYKDIWEAELDEELPCQKEPLNIVDPFAVAVSQIVGHENLSMQKKLKG